MESNDVFLLKTIILYCNDINSAVERFSLTEEIISNDKDMKALMAFFVQQIGETASKLSRKFKDTHPEIEWGAVIGFRHHIVHAYGKIVPSILWDTVRNDVPELRNVCESILKDSNPNE